MGDINTDYSSFKMRSFFVPAHIQHFHEKDLASDANVVVLDLEDGIPINQKNQSRGRVVSAGCKQIGIQNPIEAESLEEYISIQKKMALNYSYKEDITDQILTKSKEKLFNDKSIYKQYINFFNESIKAV